jgi:hypothetical protein
MHAFGPTYMHGIQLILDKENAIKENAIKLPLMFSRFMPNLHYYFGRYSSRLAYELTSKYNVWVVIGRRMSIQKMQFRCTPRVTT